MELSEVSSDTINQIYEVAGGNPLALKLIVGQVQVRSLGRVLDDFKSARGEPIEALYAYIYEKAWHLLDPNAQKILLIMPMVTSQGTTIDHLMKVTELTEAEVYRGLDLLTRLSLVHVGGSIQARRYGIHRLTETFLHEQVTKWMTS
ncbi:MAG: hypothetical protein AAF485_33370, partial [Chloroflexota bacterium]